MMENLPGVWSLARGSQMAKVKLSEEEDSILGHGPEDDDSECSPGHDSDSGSLLSDDSVLPDYEREDNAQGTAKTLYQACAKNQGSSLRRVLERGVTEEEVMELDINGRVGVQLSSVFPPWALE